MSAQPGHRDVWATGDAYQRYMGRWSRPVARKFLLWLALPPDGRWLDIGCGTGVVTQTVLECAAPIEVLGVDSSEGFLELARRNTADSRASFRMGDAQNLPLADNSVDNAVSGLVLNFMPDKAKALAEMKRVTRPGGTVAFYVWDYAGDMQLIRTFWEAAVFLNPAAESLDEARRFKECDPDSLASLLAESGLRDVEVHAIDSTAIFENFDDYWSPFLGGQGPAPTYCAALSEDQRSELRGQLLATLPIEPDGTIRLKARAFAGRGRSPG
ncbi:MAG: class I SAM-dependent methyltransferase [Xanthobacteraceae bacterium]